MSSDGPNGDANPRNRRSSITQAALSNLFQRGAGQTGQNSVSTNDPQRRRLSVSTVGLGPQANTPGLGIRRSSMSTNSNPDSIDESAIEDDEFGSYSKTVPNTPFARRMSFGGTAMRGYRPGGSPGNDQQGFNWSEQLRSRAESSFSNGARTSFSIPSGSPPRNTSTFHDCARSVSDMPQPPAQMQPKQERPKPDAFQERILKGDFYMD